MATDKVDRSRFLIQQLSIINQLLLKAYGAETLQELQFIILNDTIHLIRYDRASLWSLEKKTPQLLGISGQTDVNLNSELSQHMTHLVESIQEKSKAQRLAKESFPNTVEWEAIVPATNSIAIWFPIEANKKTSFALLLEKWDIKPEDIPANDVMDLCGTFIIPGYGQALEKFNVTRWFKRLLSFKNLLYLIPLLLMLLLLIRVPLRIVAPCEIVPADPYVITSPLEGIIEQILVKPGKNVKAGEILFSYDKRVPLKELEIAEKQVAIAQAEINRTEGLGYSGDKKSFAELAVLNEKLEKEKVQLNYAKYQASLLDFKSPIEGIVILDNPDEWRGRPVKIGEKVLIVSDPNKTKIKIWIPENDNIPLRLDSNVTIFLSVDPINSYEAKLNYIANEVSLSDKKIPSFLAEAEWVTYPEKIKLGLTGNAILYGERVSLLYFLLRKPWGTFRHFFEF